MEIEEAQAKLNHIRFKKCEDINIGDVLYYELQFKMPKKMIIKALAGIGKTMCLQSITIEFRGNNPTVLCLFSKSYYKRKEHLTAFRHVTDLLNNCVKVIPCSYFFCGFKIKNIILPFIWCKQMKALHFNFGLRLFLARKLFEFFMDYEYVMEQCRKNKIKIEKMISYCDVMPEDSFFIQKLKKRKAIGITLQHGFLSPSANTWVCKGSYSDYFLTDSKYSTEIAKKAGYKGKILNVGSVHYVGKKEFIRPKKFKTEIIGVFLNGECLREINISMLKILQQFCKKTDKRLLVKFHPTSDIKEYERFLDKTIAEFYSTEISAANFGEMIDIAIVSFSNTFIEMLNQWVPSLLYIGENDILPFIGVDFLKFNTEEQLKKLLKKFEMGFFNNRIEQLRYYYCQEDNLEKRYKKAFDSLGID